MAQVKGLFSSQLNKFLESKSSFQILFSTETNFINHSLNRLLILDSSFNPPHKGHYSLISRALKHGYSSQEGDKVNQHSVLLMLSVKNADKLSNKPASFEDRLDMMYLLAKFVSSSLRVPVAIALTNHAKFVDKSEVIEKWVSDELDNLENSLKLTFLVGFDTLIRIFNPKYYQPSTIKDALHNFMLNSDLFCLTRSDDQKFTLEEQQHFINDIEEGKNKDIPQKWSQSIHVGEGDEGVLNISSSKIRSELQIPTNHTWESETIDSIVDYIKSNNIYVYDC